jgi:hypothetical protein
MEEVEGSIFDGGSGVTAGATVLLDAPTTEGDRVLHVLTGLGPLVR